MKRALVLVEGQTEQGFVKQVLQPHFWGQSLHLEPVVLETRKIKSGGGFRGGVTSFGKFENHLRRLLAPGGAALVTTMLDYYRLPADFPGMSDRPAGGGLARARHVEQAVHTHFGSRPDLLPYLSLHEFEALLFSSDDELTKALAAQAAPAIAALRQQYGNPEEINERPGNSPSERILALFPGYAKRVHGPTVAHRIGLAALRRECPHFNSWVTALEAFAASA